MMVMPESLDLQAILANCAHSPMGTTNPPNRRLRCYGYGGNPSVANYYCN